MSISSNRFDRRTVIAAGLGAALMTTQSARAQPGPQETTSLDPLGRIPLEKHAYSPISTSGIGERNTVSNGPDDNANNLMASHFWNVKRHGTTQQAIDNGLIATLLKTDPPLPGILTAPGMNMGGHGNEGLVETGMGQTGPFNTNQIVYRWNESAWGPQLDRLLPTPITMLSIWSCHTGAGQSGADLLFLMAKHIGRAVAGRTGFTYNNNQQTWFENGSVWQVATPDNKPAPIAAPTPHTLIASEVRFMLNGKILGLGDVQTVRISRRELGASASTTKTVSERSIASQLFVGPPIALDVTIAGMITGTITLGFGAGGELELTIYNDRLAVDLQSKTGYYLVGGFSELYSTAQ